jgi:hypothetical protein
MPGTTFTHLMVIHYQLTQLTTQVDFVGYSTLFIYTWKTPKAYVQIEVRDSVWEVEQISGIVTWHTPLYQHDVFVSLPFNYITR